MSKRTIAKVKPRSKGMTRYIGLRLPEPLCQEIESAVKKRNATDVLNPKIGVSALIREILIQSLQNNQPNDIP